MCLRQHLYGTDGRADQANCKWIWPNTFRTYFEGLFDTGFGTGNYILLVSLEGAFILESDKNRGNTEICLQFYCLRRLFRISSLFARHLSDILLSRKPNVEKVHSCGKHAPQYWHCVASMTGANVLISIINYMTFRAMREANNKLDLGNLADFLVLFVILKNKINFSNF